MRRIPNELKHRLILTMLLAVAMIAAQILLTPQTVSTTIGIQFEGIDKGLNPDGTRFDFDALRDEVVVEKICKLAGVAYTPNIRDYIEIKPMLPRGIVEHIKSKRIKGEAYTYFPSEFQVRIKTGFIGGIPIWDALKISKSYYPGYAAYFKETYQFPYLNLTKLVKEYQNTAYDYPEIALVYENQFNILTSYLSVLNTQDPLFATKQGFTFKDLIASLKVTQELDLDRISALVNNSSLTKDKSQLILKYQYMLKRYAFEQQEDQSDYAVSSELLSLLKAKENTMVLPDVSGAPVTVSALDDSYDRLAQNANESQVRAGQRNADAVYIQQQIDRLNAQGVEKATLDQAQKEADRLISQLNIKMGTWIKTIESASNEYFVYKYGKAVTLHSPAAISGMGVKRLGLMVGFLWALLFGGTIALKYFKNPDHITALRNRAAKMQFFKLQKDAP